MAEEELQAQTEENAEGGEGGEGGGDAAAPAKKSKGKGGKIRMLLFVLVAAIAGGGGGAATAFLTAPKAPEDPLSQEEAELPPSDSTSPMYNYVYYDIDLQPVNLNVARLNRYIKASITLALREADAETAIPMLDKRRVELTNWLMTYLAGLTLEEVQGQKNIQRIQREIRDAINEQLWPDRRPRVEQVLFKEFAIQ